MRRPLHLIKDTKKSILSQEAISFFNSVPICGSWTAPVKSELCAIEVTGRTISALSFIPYMPLVLSNKAKSCSALLSTERLSKSLSRVSVLIVDTILFANSICDCMSPPLSTILSRPLSTTCVMYLESILAASALSMGALFMSLSWEPSSSSPRPLFITSSYSPFLSIFIFPLKNTLCSSK